MTGSNQCDMGIAHTSFTPADDNKLQQAIRVNSALADISVVISNHSGSLKELGDAALAFLLKYFECCYGAVLIHQPEKNILELTSELGGDTSQPRGLTVKPGETITGNVFLQGEMKYLKEVPGDFLYNISSGAGSLPASYIAILPLKFNNTVAGVAELACFCPFEKDDLTVAERLCENIAASVINLRTSFENAQLVEELQIIREKANARVERQYAAMQRTTKDLIEKHKIREQELLDEIERLKQQTA